MRTGMVTALVLIVAGAVLVALGFGSLQRAAREDAALTTTAEQAEMEAERERYRRAAEAELARSRGDRAEERRELEKKAAQHTSELAALNRAQLRARSEHAQALAALAHKRGELVRAKAALVESEARLAARERAFDEAQRALPQKRIALAAARSDEAARRAQLDQVAAEAKALREQREPLSAELRSAEARLAAFPDLPADSFEPPDPRRVQVAEEVRSLRLKIGETDARSAELEAQRQNLEREHALSLRKLEALQAEMGSQNVAVAQEVDAARQARDSDRRTAEAAQTESQRAEQTVAVARRGVATAELAVQRVISSGSALEQLALQNALAGAVPGIAEYEKPGAMTVGSETRVWLRLRRSSAQAAQPMAAGGVGSARIEGLAVRARVKLRGYPRDFTIVDLNSEEQIVKPEGTRWQWGVKPERPGKQLPLTYLVTTIAEGTNAHNDIDPIDVFVVVNAVAAPEVPWHAALWDLVRNAGIKEGSLLIAGVVTSLSGVMKLAAWKQVMRLWYRVRNRRRARRKRAKGVVDVIVVSRIGVVPPLAAELCDVSVDASGFAVLVAAGAVAPVVGTEVKVEQPNGRPLLGTVTNVSVQMQRTRLGVAVHEASR